MMGWVAGGVEWVGGIKGGDDEAKGILVMLKSFFEIFVLDFSFQKSVVTWKL